MLAGPLSLLLAALIAVPSLVRCSSSLNFELRHEHSVTDDSRTVFRNLGSPVVQRGQEQSTLSEDPTVFSVRTRRTRTHRPSSNEAFTRARLRSLRHAQSEPLAWEEHYVEGPDVESRETLRTLAKMTMDAYYEAPDKEWYDLGPDWNSSYPFGWEPDQDGFRGQVFVSTDNSTVVITIKGTSAGWISGGDSRTAKKDKMNDNLLFSCCCARVGPTWYTVCDCYFGGYKCDQTCVENSLIEDSIFYSVGTNLYNNVTYMYPEANIWVVGHSLGGALASLLSSTFGAPAVAFEAPGEQQASRRLHLPQAPSMLPITNVYHTADPIAMGICNGVTSGCAIAGYAMETRCHSGTIIRYDTVTKLGWAVDLRTHGIKNIIDKLLAEDWPEDAPPTESSSTPVAEKTAAWASVWPWSPKKDKDQDDKDGHKHKGREVPVPYEEIDCVDCYSWEFGDFKNPPPASH